MTNEVVASTVVVVDDSAIDSELIKAILEPTYTVLGFDNAESTLSSLENNSGSDLFLIDFNLPKMNGVELCKQLRNDSRFAYTPIIIITGETYVIFEEQFWDAGCDDFIAKPFSAITLQRRVEKALKYQKLIDEFKDAAMIDSLTKVFNRRYLDAIMQQMTTRSENPEISVLLFDVDLFKKYNDRYGHLAGDSALVMVANAAKSSLLRETDFVSRWGGEEFAVILPHTDERGAQKIANRILKTVRNDAILHEDSPSKVLTVSIGGVTFPSAPKDWRGLFEIADELLYEAKESGRDMAQLTTRDHPES